MLSNTGTISFVIYGIFIAVTITAMFFAFYFIRKGTIEADKLDKMIDLFKYTIVSVAIATVTLVVSDLFKERDQDVKELEYFDKYVEDVKKADGILERFQLSKYLSIVAPSGALKESWRQYYDTVKAEYSEYLRLKKEEKRLDTIQNPTLNQEAEKEQIKSEIARKDAPLVSYSKAMANTGNKQLALTLEEKGFGYLLQKDVDNAITAFTESENAYNQFHMVYEISRFLRQNRAKLSDPASDFWKTAYSKIANDYAYGMPESVKSRLRDNLR